MNTASTFRRKRRWPRILLTIVVAVAACVLGLAIWWNVSVVPRVLVIRNIPGSDALDGGRGLLPYVPDSVAEFNDLAYGGGPDDRLDIYHPANATSALPTIFWMHGGGFISGNKEGTRNYLMILASHGYTVVNVEYTPAPEKKWPHPMVQLKGAVDFVTANAEKYYADTTTVVLGGDSAGAHMSAQAAVAVTNPDYALQSGVPAVMSPTQLIGTILFSGPYDIHLVKTDNPTFSFYLNTVMWAYTGERDFQNADNTPYYSVTPWVTSDYPPSFVSTGPADPLLRHSTQLVDKMQAEGVDVTPLFFPPETTSEAIGHEYEMLLDTPEGQQALAAVLKFLQRVSTPPPLQP